MANNAQKTPLALTLPQFTQKKVLDAIQLLGKALPCTVVATNGWIVTVKFEIQSPNPNQPITLPQVTIPVAYPPYTYIPFQVGDPGICVPSDVYLGGISGLGGSVADLSLQANLSALVFVPCGNANTDAPTNANALELYGPQGVIVRDVGKNCVITLTPTTITVVGKTSITVRVGSNASITMADGEIDISATTLKLNGTVWDTHMHTDVTSGSSDTGPVA